MKTTEETIKRIEQFIAFEASEIELRRANFALGFQKAKKKYTIKRKSDNPFDVEKIARVVADYYDVPFGSIIVKTKKREIVTVRQIAMYFSRLLTRCSLSVIGNQIGSKDHATVLHASKTISNLIDTDKKIKAEIEELLMILNGQLV